MLELKEYNRTESPNWCPGCADFAILNSVKKTLQELDIGPHDDVRRGAAGHLELDLVVVLSPRRAFERHGRARLLGDHRPVVVPEVAPPSAETDVRDLGGGRFLGRGRGLGWCGSLGGGGRTARCKRPGAGHDAPPQELTARNSARFAFHLDTSFLLRQCFCISKTLSAEPIRAA